MAIGHDRDDVGRALVAPASTKYTPSQITSANDEVGAQRPRRQRAHRGLADTCAGPRDVITLEAEQRKADGTFASPPPKVAPSIGDEETARIRRAEPNMISPNVTTLGSCLFLACRWGPTPTTCASQPWCSFLVVVVAHPHDCASQPLAAHSYLSWGHPPTLYVAAFGCSFLVCRGPHPTTCASQLWLLILLVCRGAHPHDCASQPWRSFFSLSWAPPPRLPRSLWLLIL